jgi:predicted ribosome quality control (RQC) complex YloA/Tae2 family protein
MKDFVPVENHRDLVRDTHSKAILTTSTKEINEYQERKRIAEAKTDRINRLEESLQKINEQFSKVLERLNDIERRIG